MIAKRTKIQIHPLREEEKKKIQKEGPDRIRTGDLLFTRQAL